MKRDHANAREAKAASRRAPRDSRSRSRRWPKDSKLYQRMRRFDETPEPSGKVAAKKTASAKTASASIEADGPCALIRDPEARRAASALRLPARARRHAEELGGAQGAEPRPGRQAAGGARRGSSARLRPFEGEIPRASTARGSVIVWDHGTWEPVGSIAARGGLSRPASSSSGSHGEKLHGGWTLVRSAHARQRATGAVAADQGARRGRRAPTADYDIVLKSRAAC